MGSLKNMSLVSTNKTRSKKTQRYQEKKNTNIGNHDKNAPVQWRILLWWKIGHNTEKIGHSPAKGPLKLQMFAPENSSFFLLMNDEQRKRVAAIAKEIAKLNVQLVEAICKNSPPFGMGIFDFHSQLCGIYVPLLAKDNKMAPLVDHPVHHLALAIAKLCSVDYYKLISEITKEHNFKTRSAIGSEARNILARDDAQAVKDMEKVVADFSNISNSNVWKLNLYK
eukprot:TRINITY_DN4250_c0_g2_i1.p1 TRINITY_DN4250_c0_g2~~TRINITY_DN4250_c0_g2_i1.p1  ORF type:complete len:224 (+),score=17.25 TRINITY_DN4250_c0_g2_i1:248-919(+)